VSGAIRVVRDGDRELAARCAAGERAAQRLLFAEQKAVVHRTLYRILGGNRDVEDLVQESFLEAFRSIGSFRGDAKLSTWIASIAAHSAMAYLGRQRPASVSLEAVHDVPSGEPDALRRVMAREAMRRLYAALDQLEVRQRTAFALHAVDGLPIAEVAAIMRASQVATRTRVSRARRNIDERARRDPVLAELVARALGRDGDGGAP
jgi:RNA polymerase sigma-70 factor (ECF subfamily)